MEKIRFEHITKTFGSVVANHDISFSIDKGEVLSILGENGSGKTTLLNVLGGLYQQDEGKVYIDGEEAVINSPKDSYHYRIGMVHQHFKLVNVFSAVENIVLGMSKKEYLQVAEMYDPDFANKKHYRFSLKEAAGVIKKMCDRYGFILDPEQHVYDMSVSEKQTLEIVKVLFRGIDTLILDEPTAVLTPQEIKHLFDVVRNMRKDGKTIIIITHKLNEVLEISDHIAILRKGEFIEKIPTKKANESMLADLMVGKKVDLDIRREDIPNTGKRLIVEHLSVLNKAGELAVKDVSFDVYGSEILGIAGISGSGQKELLEGISGLAKTVEGKITFINPKKDRPVTFYHKDVKQVRDLSTKGKFYHIDSGKEVNLSSISNREIVKQVNEKKIIFYEDEIIDITSKKPIEIRDYGIKLSFVPEDRLGMGLVGSMNIVDNMLLRSFRKGKGRMLHKEKSKALAQQIIADLGVQIPNLDTQVSKLSGGNIQKVLVGRELSSHPKIMMAAYPVRGLDINSSYLIYNLLERQKNAGTAVIYVGEDLDVLMALCDRILVMANGKISGIVDPRKVTKEEIGLLMAKSE